MMSKWQMEVMTWPLWEDNDSFLCSLLHSKYSRLFSVILRALSWRDFLIGRFDSIDLSKLKVLAFAKVRRKKQRKDPRLCDRVTLLAVINHSLSLLCAFSRYLSLPIESLLNLSPSPPDLFSVWAARKKRCHWSFEDPQNMETPPSKSMFPIPRPYGKPRLRPPRTFPFLPIACLSSS